MIVSPQISTRVARTLRQNSLLELIEGIQQINLLKPEVERRFWRSQDAKPGIYVIVKNKVRSLDCNNDLAASVGTGLILRKLIYFMIIFKRILL